ncbi:MAG: ATP12 family protein [Methylocystis sp.]
MSKKPTGFDADFFVPDAERDPVKAARDPARALPKRFYKEAVAAPTEGGYGIFLDGRRVNTPAKRPQVAPSRELAEALASEWAGQGETIDPATMPLTKLVNTALDGVEAQMAEVEAEVANYAASDLVCYRAGEPESLAAAQSAAWDPLVAFARDRLGAKLALAEGVMFVEQPQAALGAFGRALRAYIGEGPGAPFRLAALHVMTTLTGSAVIALAVALGELDPARAWDAANVDEDWQMRAWGADAEAMARRAARYRELEAAATVSRLSTPE